jgi:ABC-type phosphate transport system substrate-binding protein
MSRSMRSRERPTPNQGPDRGRRACVVLAGAGAASVLLSFVLESSAQSQGEFKLIVHPDNPLASATRRLVSDAFLRNVGKWSDGRSIMPVDLRADSKVRERFSDRVHGRSVSAVKRYWQQRIFSGSGVPPPELESEEAVIAYVLKHRGGIGYVSADAAVGKAKTLAVR